MPWGFLRGAVVKNPPSNARDTNSTPGPGRFHMPQSSSAYALDLLSLHSLAHAPQQEKPPQWEAQAPQLESSPCSLKLKKAHVQPRAAHIQYSQK